MASALGWAAFWLTEMIPSSSSAEAFATPNPATRLTDKTVTIKVRFMARFLGVGLGLCC